MRNIKNLIRKADEKLLTSSLPLDYSQLNMHSQIMYNTSQYEQANLPEPLRKYYEERTKGWIIHKLYFVQKGGCIIEPKLGWGLTKKWEVLPFSNFNLHIHNFPKPLYINYEAV